MFEDVLDEQREPDKLGNPSESPLVVG